MAKQKPRTDWNDNLSDWKDKAVGAAKVVASRAVVGPLNVAMSNKQVKSVAAETSGVNDVKRFKANPSVSTGLMVGLSATQYVAPLVKPIQALRAVRAANVARELPVAKSALIKTVRLGKNPATGMREGNLLGIGEVRRTIQPPSMQRLEQSNLFGRDMQARNFTAFQTTKSPARIASSRATIASRNVIRQGKQLESNLNIIAATKSAVSTARAMERKIKKK
tara:strand:- start:82 stop:747 length:666 start_codon:yes stop_codon:yes gene_type:complete